MNDKVFINNKKITALEVNSLVTLEGLISSFVDDMRLVEDEAFQMALDSHGICSLNSIKLAAAQGRIVRHECSEPENSYKYILDNVIPLITVEPTGGFTADTFDFSKSPTGEDLKFGYKITAYING